MKLPSIDKCPRCSRESEDLYREAQHVPARRASVYDRMGPVNEEEEGFDQEYYQDADADQEDANQWCSSGIFTKSQKRRAHRMRCKEIRRKQYQHDDQDEGPAGKKVWSPKVRSQVHKLSAPVHMVFLLPNEFSLLVVNETEEETARLIFDPQQAIFNKPAGNNYLHLKALYMKGFINGKPTSKMLFDGGAAVNVMLMTTHRKIGGLPEEQIKSNMTLRDYDG